MVYLNYTAIAIGTVLVFLFAYVCVKIVRETRVVCYKRCKDCGYTEKADSPAPGHICSQGWREAGAG